MADFDFPVDVYVVRPLADVTSFAPPVTRAMPAPTIAGVRTDNSGLDMYGFRHTGDVTVDSQTYLAP